MRPSRKYAGSTQAKSQLERCGFLRQTLSPTSVVTFRETVNASFSKFRKQPSQSLSKTTPCQQVESWLQVLKQAEGELSVNFLVKKIAVLHVSLHECARWNYYNEQLEGLLKKELQLMVAEELPKLVVGNTRRSSLSKLVDYIREMSASKDAKHKNGKLQIERQHERTALKEIASKVVQPLCMYLLRLVQDYSSYELAIRNDQKDAEDSTLWKWVNSSRSLGEIVMELNRLGRYFREDLTGIWVFSAYLMSLDLAIYYDRLKRHIDTDCQFWSTQITAASSGAHVEAILDNAAFTELKRYMQEMSLMRDKLNYVYLNKELRAWRKHFVKPLLYKDTPNSTTAAAIASVMQFLEKFDQKTGRLKMKKRRSVEETADLEVEIEFEKTFEGADAVTECNSPQDHSQIRQSHSQLPQIDYELVESQPCLNIMRRYAPQLRRGNFLTQIKHCPDLHA